MIRKLCLVTLLWIAIAFTPFVPIDSAQADNMKVNPNNARQAAEKVVQDTGVKEQFGKSENGDRLLDNAQQKANQKLNEMAEEADSDRDLPDSKKLFLNNLKGK